MVRNLGVLVKVSELIPSLATQIKEAIGSAALLTFPDVDFAWPEVSIS